MWKCFCNILGFLVLAGVVYGQEIVTDTDKRYSVEVPKGWAVEAKKDDIDLKLGQVTIHVYPAFDTLTTLDAVIDNITQNYNKQGITTGPKQRLAFPGGEALWTEAPGTERPYLGAVSRNGKFFFVNAEDKAKNASGILEVFLAAVRSVRPAAPAQASQKTSKPGQKPAQTPQTSSSAPPKATAGPLASAKPSPWNLSDLQKQAKALSASDIPSLRKRATGGDALSQFLLGLVYEFGHAGITKDLQQALSWFKQAAEQGIGLPQAWVGDFYYQGIGTAVDFAEATRWYTRASNNGYHYASRMAGYLYLAGQGVARDYFEARGRFQAAANGGDETARKIVADLERNCGTQACVDLQTLLALRRRNFDLLQGEKLDETTKTEDLFGLLYATITRRWRGKLPISSAESCEVKSRESELGASTTWYYSCSLGRRLTTEAEADRRFDAIVAEIRAAVPASAKLTYCGVEGCRSSPTSNRFSFSVGFSKGDGSVSVGAGLMSRIDEPDRFEVSFSVSGKD